MPTQNDSLRTDVQGVMVNTIPQSKFDRPKLIIAPKDVHVHVLAGRGRRTSRRIAFRPEFGPWVRLGYRPPLLERNTQLDAISNGTFPLVSWKAGRDWHSNFFAFRQTSDGSENTCIHA